jgi:serine/threonine protein kinase
VDHIRQIVDLLGPLPSTLIREGKLWTTLCAQVRVFERLLFLHPIQRLQKGAEKFMSMRQQTKTIVDRLRFGGQEKQLQAHAIGDFLLPMLALKPDERATAAQCLAHSWLSSSV